MPFYVTKPLNIALEDSVIDVKERLLAFLRLRPDELKSFSLRRQSVDARDKSYVHYVCSYIVETSRHPANAVEYEQPVDVLQQAAKDVVGNCVIVGAGPAGLFAALYLCKRGVNVTVVERGSDISKRQSDVRRFFEGGAFCPESNVQFGLGGAGTFSDGKLTSGISSPFTYSVFRQFVRSGAPEDILYSALPHVGTDRLAVVVANLRDEIVRLGGRFLFDSAAEDFIVEGGKVAGIVLRDGMKLRCDRVLLGCGHSARDVFASLYDRGAQVIFKPFAVGLRVEHTRKFVNTAQYGALFATHRDLPSASYKLVYNGERSCYSFCMCPGGTVVAANSESNSVVVNGMSNYARDADNSNSALVVNVTADDIARYGFGDGPFAGVDFQRDLERRAYLAGGGNYVAPCQNVSDFIADRATKQFDVAPSYPRGVRSTNLRDLLPQPVAATLCEALTHFDSKIRGFASCGVLTGVESRTSSPVRIVRDESFQSNLRHLYPMGEGAGYAGGIVSAAVDGLRVAQAVALSLRK